MNYKMMGQFVAKIVAVEAAFMVPALLISLFCGESAALRGFLMALGVIAVVEALLIAFCRKSERGFDEKEGLVSVGIGWIALSLLGCLPFYFSGEIPLYVDAFLRSSPASLPPAPPSSPTWRAVPRASCTGAASATGWAAWACWCFCWP